VSSSFLAYIDEAGDEGFRFNAGSSLWFVLSAVIIRREADLDTGKLVDTVRRAIGKSPKKPLHFRDLKHDHCVFFIGEIAKSHVRHVTVCCHKPSLKEPEVFVKESRLYFYMVRYLLERVSWCCRDHRHEAKTGDGTVELVFSNRSMTPYAGLKEYLGYLKRLSGPLDVRIDWNVVKGEQFSVYGATSRMGLQIADAVASGYYAGLQPNRFGYTEPRYAEMMRPITYAYKGRALGYGLKFWPRETDELVRTADQLGWVREHYEMKNAGPGPQDPTP